MQIARTLAVGGCWGIDDGLRSGLLTLDLLESQELWKRAQANRRAELGEADSFSVARTQTIGVLLDTLNTDLIEETTRRKDEILLGGSLRSLWLHLL